MDYNSRFWMMGLRSSNGRFRVLILALVCGIAVAACTNSRLVLRPLYNSLDNQLQKQILEYIEFDDSQRAAIEDIVDHFHVWHRQTQIRHYAELASVVSVRLKSSSRITPAMIESWSRSLREYGATLGQCSPIYQGHAVLATLDNTQVEQLQKNRNAQLESWRGDNVSQGEAVDASAAEAAELIEDQAENRAQRQAKRLKQVRRYIELAGLEISESQYRDLKSTYASQRYPETRFRTVLTEWDSRFFTLLQHRDSETWPAQLTDYLDSRRQAFRNRRVAVRAYNTQLWEDYAERTLNTLSGEQRGFVGNWLGKLSTTLKSIAKDQPSYTAKSAIDYSCPGVRLAD